jgi:hypothetical protein
MSWVVITTVAPSLTGGSAGAGISGGGGIVRQNHDISFDN